MKDNNRKLQKKGGKDYCIDKSIYRSLETKLKTLSKLSKFKNFLGKILRKNYGKKLETLNNHSMFKNV